jgi:hypothetical protein
MIWLFVILLVLYGGFISFALFHAFKRINQYENYLIEFQQIISFSTEKMKSVDASGHYESDDETGFFFEQLKQIQILLSEIFETEENTDGTEKKK